MNPELKAWGELRTIATRQLKTDFAQDVIRRACEKRKRTHVENHLILLTAFVCFLTINLTHWISAARTHENRLVLWQEIINQTEIIQSL